MNALRFDRRASVTPALRRVLLATAGLWLAGWVHFAHAVLMPSEGAVVVMTPPEQPTTIAVIAQDIDPISGEYVVCVLIEPVINPDTEWRVRCTQRRADDTELRAISLGYAEIFAAVGTGDSFVPDYRQMDVQLRPDGSFLIMLLSDGSLAGFNRPLVVSVAAPGAPDLIEFALDTFLLSDGARLARTAFGFVLASFRRFTTPGGRFVRYDDNGQFLGTNIFGSGNTCDVGIAGARDNSGEYLLFWVENLESDDFLCRGTIRAQAYDGQGNPLGDPVNVSAAGSLSEPRLYTRPEGTALFGGGYAITWEKNAHLATAENEVEVAVLSRTGGRIKGPDTLGSGLRSPRIGSGDGADYAVVSCQRSGGNCPSLDGRLSFEGDAEPVQAFSVPDPYPGLRPASVVALTPDGRPQVASYRAEFSQQTGLISTVKVERYARPALFEIASVSVTEGDPQRGQGPLAVVPVSLVRGHAAGEDVAVEYFSLEDTATEGVDYVGQLGRLDFAGGAAGTQFLEIPILPDDTFETDERFFVQLHLPDNAVIRPSRSRATVVIENDDLTPPVAAVCDGQDPVLCYTVTEPDEGQTTVLQVLVRMAEPIEVDFRIDYQTADLTGPQSATAGQDYQPASGSLALPAGATEVIVPITILGDPPGNPEVEPTERFELQLSGPSGIDLPNPVIEVQILDDPFCQVSIEPAGHEVPVAGGSRSFDIATLAGCDWTVTPDQPWITIDSPASGTGPATVNYTVAARTAPEVPPRFGTIQIVTDHGSTTHTVEQAGDPAFCDFSVAPGQFDFDAAGGGGNATVTAIAECAWEVFSPAAWVSVNSPTAPVNGNGALSFSVGPNVTAPNVETPSRSVLLDAPFAVQIDQTGCRFDLGQASIAVGAEGSMLESADVLTIAPCEWTARSNVPWVLVVQGAAGTGPGQVGLDIRPNFSVAPRSGTVQIADEVLTIDQDGQPCSYALNPSGLLVCPDGGTRTVEVQAPAGCSWTLEPEVPWLSVLVNASGVGAEQVQLQIDENRAETGRLGQFRLGGAATPSGVSGAVIQEGFLLLEEFTDQRPADFNYSPDAAWTATGGKLQANLLGQGFGSAMDGDLTRACFDCFVEADITITSAASNTMDDVWLYGWWRDQDNYVALTMDEFGNTWRLIEAQGGVQNIVELNAGPILPNVRYALRLRLAGDRWIGEIEGIGQLELPRNPGQPAGVVGIGVDNANVLIEELRVVGVAGNFDSLLSDSFEQAVPPDPMAICQ